MRSHSPEAAPASGEPLFDEPAVIQIHALAAMAAFVVGLTQLVFGN